MNFADFFRRATKSDEYSDGHAPYRYQERFATAPALPHLLRAPTGSGKTRAMGLAWLWRLLHGFPQTTPRRLVYCLPMRVLVEQSFGECQRWLKNLDLSKQVGLHLLMGGEEPKPWHLHPQRPTILIGTQDMLLSRALNRGYAASRFHWPIDFGLLNNDCLWVFDEPQLMAGGVSTSAQLAGLRHSLQTSGTCSSVWMSATLEPSWLDTVDFRGKFAAPSLELTDEDYAPGLPLHHRMTAQKTLAELDASSAKDMKAVAKAVNTKHVIGTTTLVILNTVDRAKATYEELLKLRKQSATPELLLIHSRFRPHERIKLNKALTGKDQPKDRIIVSTQVVEAGVDLSARTLVTELCPWSSVVQRIGRCNRTGDDGPGQVFWIDLDENLTLPYDWQDLTAAREWLRKLGGADVSPKSLDDFKTMEQIQLPFQHKHVLRRRDLLDLFDTAPDLSGNDIDISRFVRSDDPDTDVLVFWRKVVPSKDVETPGPRREELCRVPVQKAKDFVDALPGKKRGPVYYWDHLDDEWKRLESKQIRPGMTILLPCEVGGYSELGWDDASPVEVPEVPFDNAVLSISEEGMSSDPISTLPLPEPLTVAQHTQNVCDELQLLLGESEISHQQLPVDSHAACLKTAARWHDLGKAHAAFQDGMRKSNPELPPDQLWAKSGKSGKLIHGRPFFRHELASALAIVKEHPEWPSEVAYLVAAHHGRVRLSIRSAPGEDLTEGDTSIRFALGNRDGDLIPATDLGGGVNSPTTTLDLSPMVMGSESSWSERALKLLQDMGPFRLAYLEAILRAADVRASKKEAGKDV